jgi:predicted aspartyl protease
MSIEARFYVAEFNERAIGAANPETGEVATMANVVLNAVTRKMGEDNVQWSEYSPAGQMTISVTQKKGGAYEAFRNLLGKDVRILIDGIE